MKDTKAAITLIITVYNGEKYLKKCLDAVVSQRFRDFRLILVDDGSIDDSGRIGDQYARQYADFIQIVHQQNGGLSNARNTGMQYADSEYIAFADADDMLAEDYLEKLYRAAQDNTADYVICGYTRIDEQGNILGVRKATDWEMPLLDGRNHVFTYTAWGRLYRTELIRESRLQFSDGEGLEDIPFNIYMNIVADKCIAIDYEGYLYRVTGESITELIKHKGVKAASSVMKFPFQGLQHTIELMRENHGNRYDDILCYEIVKNLAGLLFFIADSSDRDAIKRVSIYEQELVQKSFGDIRKNPYLRIRALPGLPFTYRVAVYLFASAYRHSRIYEFAMFYKKLAVIAKLKKV